MQLHKQLFISALLASAPFASAQSGSTSAGGQDPVEGRLTEGVLNLADLAQVGDIQATDNEGVVVIIDEWDEGAPQFPETKALRQALSSYMDALLERAQNAFIEARHVAFLKQQILDIQLEEALAELLQRARNGGWTRSHYEAVRDKLMARADAAVDEASSAYLRRRFDDLVSAALGRAQNAFAKSVEEFRVEMIRFRLNRALQELRQDMTSGGISQASFESLVTLLTSQARGAVSG